MKPTLEYLVNLARQAGQILRAGMDNAHQVVYKGTIDLVTEMDHQAEAYLLGEIRGAFPNHFIMSEESGSFSGDCDCAWYIDPLDGTVNYAHRIPLFAVSLAYAEQGQTRLGVVYQPILDECFSAERGRGAWLNGKPLHVSHPPDLDHSLLVTGFAYDIRSRPDNNLDCYAQFALRSQGVRRLGSAALDCCYVADGRFDGYWELFIRPWDIAAGALVAEEAGAQVTGAHGEADYLNESSSILAAPPEIHAQMLRLLRA